MKHEITDEMVERACEKYAQLWKPEGVEMSPERMELLLEYALNGPQRRYTDTPREERRKGVEAPSGASSERIVARVGRKALEKEIGCKPKVGDAVPWRAFEYASGFTGGLNPMGHPPIITVVDDDVCCVSYERVSAAKHKDDAWDGLGPGGA